MDPTAFLEEFRAEANEHLRAMDAQLLKLERDPRDPRPIREMFLSAHTVKGGAAMLGLEGVRVLAHAMEDVLSHLRDERQSLDTETADLLFRALDKLRELVSWAVPGGAGPEPATAQLADALRQRAAALVPSAPPAAEERPAAAERRALIVEASPTVRLLHQTLLSESGFQVDAVPDGQQALALARANRYHLVVSAIETQGLRGFELAAALREMPAYRQVPIILMSSDDNPLHRQQAAEVGVQAYIRKGSFGERRLVEAARELVGGRRA